MAIKMIMQLSEKETFVIVGEYDGSGKETLNINKYFRKMFCKDL